MNNTRIIIIKPGNGLNLSDQLNGCLTSIREKLQALGLDSRDIVRQTVFIDAAGNEDFYKKRESLLAVMKGFYDTYFPPTTVVGQPPEAGSLVCIELWVLSRKDAGTEIEVKEIDGTDYIVVRYPGYSEIHASGLTASADCTDRLVQAETALGLMKKILDAEGLDFSDVVRQWNYIEGIIDATSGDDGCKQNYQIFNDARSIFYGEAAFKNGYPSATGIGMNCGGIVLEFIAVIISPDMASDMASDMAIIPIKNPLQVDAHRYSQQVLVGEAVRGLSQKTTPKFERAKVVVRNRSYCIYISGTAAIQGQDSVSDRDVVMQTRVTIENILKLVGADNLQAHGIFRSRVPDILSYFRVYVKNGVDIPLVRGVCGEYFQGVPCLYLVSDICRDDLLVEIEGAAESSR